MPASARPQLAALAGKPASLAATLIARAPPLRFGALCSVPGFGIVQQPAAADVLEFADAES